MGLRSTANSTAIRICLVIAGIAASNASADGVSELDDAAARMQYAFYTADVRGIEDALSIVQRVELSSSLAGMKEYYTAFGQWKLAELHTAQAANGMKEARSRATKAAKACVDAAEQATGLDARMSEAHAINAACSSLGSRMLGNSALVGGCAKHKALRTALERDAANPRIRLIEAQCLAQAEKAPSAATIERARAVVAAFEAAPPSKPGHSDWGQAEALLALGKLELARGDAVAARDVVERALVIAPDYREAQRLLARASGSER